MDAQAEINLLGHKLFEQVDRIFACVDGASDDELNWRPTSENTNTLAVLATHIMGNLQQNIFVVLLGGEDHRDRDAEFQVEGASAAILMQQWTDLRSRIEGALNTMPGDILDREYDHPRRGRSSGRELLLNAALHAAEHAGHAELTRDLIKAQGQGG